VVLSGLGAFRAGAGKVLLAVPQSLAQGIAISFPEAGVHGFAESREGAPSPGKAAEQIAALVSEANVTLVGPGLVDQSAAQQLAHSILEAAGNKCFVVDALALTGLWREQALTSRLAGQLILTPHAGEMAQLLGTTVERVSADPVQAAQAAAAHLNCVIVLKGAVTVIAPPGGAIYVHEEGIAGLATSGSGDVLAGIVSGLIARGTDPVNAAIWSVYLHARSGQRLAQRIGTIGFLARELLGEIPIVMQSALNQPFSVARSPD
jgi:hydroxyethylthiazole kinase-like uncharacterized protein yjeF